MKIAITLTPDELNTYVLAGMKAEGKPMPDGVEVDVLIAKVPAPVGPIVSGTMGGLMAGLDARAKTASTAPIGQTIDSFKVTHYGYPGDSSPDSESMKGIGDRGNKLVPGVSVALNKLAREKLGGSSGPSSGKQFVFPVLPRSTQQQTWTFQDDDSAPEVDVPRIDVYDPYYVGRDVGNTDEMYAKSKAEMVAAGILTA